MPFARVGKAPKEVYDSENGERLWNWLEEQIKIINPGARAPVVSMVFAVLVQQTNFVPCTECDVYVGG